MVDLEITDYITPEEYMEMRRIVEWSEFPLEEASEGLKNSFILVCFRIDGKPVAIGRAISDRGYVVYIADVIVVPEYQGKGLGRMVMNTIMDKIKATLKPGYRVMICLMAAQGKEEFYKKFGFVERPSEFYGCGMHQWLEGEKT